MDNIQMNTTWSVCLSLGFFILLLLSGFIHYFYKKRPQTQSADGGIVMAIGIFSLDALQTMPFTTLRLTQLIALELLIIWLYLIRGFIKQYLNGTFINSTLSQFGIGTWVAGSCVLAMLLLQALPSLSVVIWISTVLALVIGLVYAVLSAYNFWLILFKRLKLHTGIILLPTVGTQAIVLLIYSLFATSVPLLAYQSLTTLGYLFYLIGLFIIVKRLRTYPNRHMILNWPNTNSIIHGALSISGLASVTTQAFNDTLILSTWFLATSFLILNEGVSVTKCMYRVKLLGFLQGIWVYDSSQWARIFTLGMYYAFNRNLLEHHAYTNLVIKLVVSYGQYVVFTILLFEFFNYFYNQFDFKRKM